MSTKKLARELGLIRKRSQSSGGQTPTRTKQLYLYLIVIDFESTCWKEKNNRSQEIIEFPAVLLNTTTGDVEMEFHSYVQPQEHPVLSAFCTDLTGITQTQVEGGVPLHICLSRFSRWLQQLQQEKGVVFLTEKRSPTPGEKTCAFVTWSDWDLGVCLFYECQRKQLCRPELLNSWIDIRATYKLFYSRKPKGLNGALQDLGIEFSGREHSGLDDARNTARLACRMMADGCVMRLTKSLSRDLSKASSNRQDGDKTTNTETKSRLKSAIIQLRQNQGTHVNTTHTHILNARPHLKTTCTHNPSIHPDIRTAYTLDMNCTLNQNIHPHIKRAHIPNTNTPKKQNNKIHTYHYNNHTAHIPNKCISHTTNTPHTTHILDLTTSTSRTHSNANNSDTSVHTSVCESLLSPQTALNTRDCGNRAPSSSPLSLIPDNPSHLLLQFESQGRDWSEAELLVEGEESGSYDDVVLESDEGVVSNGLPCDKDMTSMSSCLVLPSPGNKQTLLGLEACPKSLNPTELHPLPHPNKDLSSYRIPGGVQNSNTCPTRYKTATPRIPLAICGNQPACPTVEKSSSPKDSLLCVPTCVNSPSLSAFGVNRPALSHSVNLPVKRPALSRPMNLPVNGPAPARSVNPSVNRSVLSFFAKDFSSVKSSIKVTSPLCACGRRARRLRVGNGGPNHGRHFYCCPVGKGGTGFRAKSRCGFFKWESALPMSSSSSSSNIHIR